MEYSQKYCLVQMISPMEVGDEFDSRDWPLHCTIAGVFALDWTNALHKEFADLVARHTAFQSATTDVAWFGLDASVKVRLIKMTDELYSLHDDIVGFVEQNGDRFNEPRFLRENFSPHITMRGDAPDSGETVLFNELTLIDMFPDGDHARRRIQSRLPLATTQEQSS